MSSKYHPLVCKFRTVLGRSDSMLQATCSHLYAAMKRVSLQFLLDIHIYTPTCSALNVSIS